MGKTLSNCEYTGSSMTINDDKSRTYSFTFTAGDVGSETLTFVLGDVGKVDTAI